MKYIVMFLWLTDISTNSIYAQHKLVPVANSWAGNSVNAVVFRKNSLVSFKQTQFVAFYNPEGKLTLGRRKLNSSNWDIKETAFSGNIRDAHNTISIMVDGEGYLHVSWDHHNNALNYARSIEPLSLELSPKMPMTGLNESAITYPEFYKMPNGNLLFLYRNGKSGKGNLVLNQYNTKLKSWKQTHSNLIDGEGKQNAYWQACVDKKGTFHISWVWRTSPDVASNHDLLYAFSDDFGESWRKSTGQKYDLPINAANAEYACHIPQNSELINQTSMAVDDFGNPFIASYWRSVSSDIPQYHVVYNASNKWKEINSGFRKTPFSLKGQGTKRTPIARPQIVVKGKGDKAEVQLFFRDSERSDRVSTAVCDIISTNNWKLFDLTNESVGAWEPSFDTELWSNKKRIHLYVQKVDQKDSEGVVKSMPTMVNVLEIQPSSKTSSL